MKIDLGEQAADRRREREADVHHPVQQAVRVDPLRRWHDVGDERERPPAGTARRRSRAPITVIAAYRSRAEHGHHDRAAEQRDHHRDAAPDAIGELAADDRRDDLARAEHRDDATGLDAEPRTSIR